MEHTTTHQSSTPAVMLRLEGLAAASVAVVLYAHLGGSGLVFAALLLAPDLAMLGYLAGPRIGASVYNSAHVYAAPLGLAVIALAVNWEAGVLLALIWMTHIGLDRVLGYGLKYATAFKDTHLSRV